MTFTNVSYVAFDTVCGTRRRGKCGLVDRDPGTIRGLSVCLVINLLSEITSREHTVTADESHLYHDGHEGHRSLPAQPVARSVSPRHPITRTAFHDVSVDLARPDLASERS